MPRFLSSDDFSLRSPTQAFLHASPLFEALHPFVINLCHEHGLEPSQLGVLSHPSLSVSLNAWILECEDSKVLEPLVRLTIQLFFLYSTLLKVSRATAVFEYFNEIVSVREGLTATTLSMLKQKKFIPTYSGIYSTGEVFLRSMPGFGAPAAPPAPEPASKSHPPKLTDLYGAQTRVHPIRELM